MMSVVRTAMFTAVTMAAMIAAETANASVTYIPYGVALPMGETLVADFRSSQPASLSAFQAPTRADLFFVGSRIGYSAAPAFSATTSDTAQYLSLKAGESATFALPSTRIVSLYAGSLDMFNAVAFGGAGAASYAGSQLAPPPSIADGSWTAAHANGRLIFTFSAPVDSITLSSSGNSFEVADIAAALPQPTALPEPTTWAMMLLGFGVIGGALRHRDARTARGRSPWIQSLNVQRI